MAVQALHHGFTDSSEYCEYVSVADAYLVCLAILSELSSLCLLHSLDQIAQELM